MSSLIEEAIKADVDRTMLNACNNFVQSIPASIAKLKKMKRLSVYDNALEELPPEIGELQSLTYLNVRFNRLQSIPKEIGLITKLRELHLEANKLTTLPIELGNLSELTKLDIRNNLLTDIPAKSIATLSKLKTLSAGGNRLGNIPLEIGLCQSLEEVWFEDNLIKALPPEFIQLKNLTRAGFDGNPMMTPPIETCQDGVEAIMLHLKDLARGFYPFPEMHPGLVLVMGNATYGLSAATNNAHAVAKVFTDHRFELFKGKVHLDLTVAQILELCKELGQVDHTTYGGVIIYHTGLGDRNGTLVGVERREIKISQLIPFFEPLSCPSLQNKPKLFFFDLCERTEDEGGRKVANEIKVRLLALPITRATVILLGMTHDVMHCAHRTHCLRISCEHLPQFQAQVTLLVALMVCHGGLISS